jgi:hypothetical protein
MKYKVKLSIKITRKIVLQLVLFAALAGIAMLVDYYFASHPGALKEFQATNENSEKEQGVVYLYSQTNNLIVKLPVQNTPNRKLLAQAHDKFVQKCHQLRNHLAFKAENKVPRQPLYLSYRHFLTRQNYFSLPDDEPLNL